MARKNTRKPRKENSGASAPPELVVIMRRQVAFRASAGRFVSEAGEKVSDISRLLSQHGATMVPLFGRPKRGCSRA